MKDDIKNVNDIARRHKMSPKERREFGDYVHKLKRSGHYGSAERGDFTYKELGQLAKEFQRK